MAKKAERFSRPHTIYRLSDGRIVPGVTSIIAASSGADKVNSLIKWANQLGKEGYDAAAESALLAEIGTATHEMIRAHLRRETANLSSFAETIQKAAQTSFDSFLLWASEHEIEPILVECPLVSEQYGYGGTLDLFADMDGHWTLIDFKTGSVYEDAFIQSAAYRQMLNEKGTDLDRVDRALILQIPRGKKETFAEHWSDNWQHDFDVFLACLRLYNLKKAVGM